MSCVKDITLLERYVDDELPDVLRRRVEAALETCEHCRQQTGALYDLRGALQAEIAAAVAEAPLEGLWEQIEAGIGPEGAAAKPTVWERLADWWSGRRIELALAGAVAAAAVAVIVWVAGALPTAERAAPKLADAVGADNTLIVESYEVHQGTIVIDVDPEDPTAPAVVWHFVEEDEDDRG